MHRLAAKKIRRKNDANRINADHSTCDAQLIVGDLIRARPPRIEASSPRRELLLKVQRSVRWAGGWQTLKTETSIAQQRRAMPLEASLRRAAVEVHLRDMRMLFKERSEIVADFAVAAN